ncbi:hypothetical protein BDR04DRAFT_246664 [Suillus decipiens]|nr:hypothetical protein BDR04DRAFT_246664 [Suillus decipiens]
MSRSKNYDNELLRVFIQTGLLPSLVTASMVVLFCWSILCRCAWSSDRKLLYYLDAIRRTGTTCSQHAGDPYDTHNNSTPLVVGLDRPRILPGPMHGHHMSHRSTVFPCLP